MHVPHVLAAGLDMMVDGIRRHGADLHQPVVLDEDGVAGQVAVHDRRHAAVEVTNWIVKNYQSQISEDLATAICMTYLN